MSKQLDGRRETMFASTYVKNKDIPSSMLSSTHKLLPDHSKVSLYEDYSILGEVVSNPN